MNKGVTNRATILRSKAANLKIALIIIYAVIVISAVCFLYTTHSYMITDVTTITVLVAAVLIYLARTFVTSQVELCKSQADILDALEDKRRNKASRFDADMPPADTFADAQPKCPF